MPRWPLMGMSYHSSVRILFGDRLNCCDSCTILFVQETIRFLPGAGQLRRLPVSSFTSLYSSYERFTFKLVAAERKQLLELVHDE